MTKKSFIKTIGEKGLLADYNTSGKKLQTELTAGDNITIDGNTISSDQVFVATYGTTKYAEIKAAYDAGKICTVFKDNRYYYITLISPTFIVFSWTNGKDMLNSLALGSGNTWSTNTGNLQLKLTFDKSPKAGSNNPVTSEGIYKSMYSLSAPAKPSSFTKDDKSYSFVCRTKVSAWTRAGFEGYAFPVDYQTFDMIRIRSIVYANPPTDSAIVSITCGKLVYEKYDFVQAIYNGYCYIFANNPFRPLYINPNKYIESDMNSSSMTQDIFQTLTLTKINPSIDDVIFDTTPTAGSTNPVTSDGIKTALDSRIPAPTSTTGTQVLKCIDGVVQWVAE